MKLKYLFATGLFLAFSLMIWAGMRDVTQERAQEYNSDYPHLKNEWFAGSGRCVECHTTDTTKSTQVDASKNDVSVTPDWAPSMMANSAKDPLWKAKVQHEVIMAENHQADIENTCTRCHAPMGNYTSQFMGNDHYGMSDLAIDSLGMDGVSCAACHRISAADLGTQVNGEHTFDPNFNIFGQYTNPWSGDMKAKSGFQPKHGSHVTKSELCQSCHTLITQTTDLNGEFIDNFFVEQATYHEWENSTFKEDNETCQSCHVPRIDDNVIISLYYKRPRKPYGIHSFTGANAFMQRLMRNNNDKVQSVATSAQFDKAIERSMNLLKSAVELDIELADLGDSIDFKVTVENKTGHKFPSGYPSRIAFLQLVVENKDGDTLFVSGQFGDDYQLIQNEDYETHYDLVRDENQVQVYEMVMGDLNGDLTTVLERAYEPLKDNRLPPKGFVSSYAAYDTVRVYGNATNDVNFNATDEEEGSGQDEVTYRIPFTPEDLVVTASMYYQSVPPKWLDEMFAHGAGDSTIQVFKEMYEAEDNTPILVQQEELIVSSSGGVQNNELLNVYPNPAKDFVFLEGPEHMPIDRVELYNLLGERMNIDYNGGVVRLPLKGNQFVLKAYSGEHRFSKIIYRLE